MAFPHRLLFDDEDVVVELRPHWIYLGWPLVATIAAGAVAIAVVVSFPHASVVVAYALVVLVGVPALWLFGRVTRWVSTSVVVTTARIFERWGVFARRTDEIRLDSVNQLSVHQNLLDRLLHVGNVYVEVPGRTGIIEYHCLSRPEVVQRIISEQVADLHRQRGGRGPVPAMASGTPGDPEAYGSPQGDRTPPTGSPTVRMTGTAEASVVDAMAQLDEMRRRGLLTDEEYATKKAELLGRL